MKGLFRVGTPPRPRRVICLKFGETQLHQDKNFRTVNVYRSRQSQQKMLLFHWNSDPSGFFLCKEITEEIDWSR